MFSVRTISEQNGNTPGLMKKPDAMLMATFFSNCFYSATYPYIYKEIMSGISGGTVAVNQIVNCLSVILFSALWNRFSDRLFPFYAVLCVLECLAGLCMSLYVTFHPENLLMYYILDTALLCGICTSLFVTFFQDILCYYLLDTLLFCLITRNIICGGVRLRAMRYPTEQLREQFDNNNNAVSAAATIIGSAVAVFLHLDFVHMVWIATIGNMTDNIFYIYIFFHSRKD